MLCRAGCGLPAHPLIRCEQAKRLAGVTEPKRVTTPRNAQAVTHKPAVTHKRSNAERQAAYRAAHLEDVRKANRERMAAKRRAV